MRLHIDDFYLHHEIAQDISITYLSKTDNIIQVPILCTFKNFPWFTYSIHVTAWQLRLSSSFSIKPAAIYYRT
ncbi:hypothetical protein SLEP1_g45322 [Rubroshorea leprosula]|uniref:Uncharacterized protein n=1 Tax=Rubroshorea leprosula TaxID=152421 RepID=A0AAV5LJG9_9ROSI|nr:hypothetical protein SLEP1_g45322 [Rubroshorea leprosula]